MIRLLRSPEGEGGGGTGDGTGETGDQGDLGNQGGDGAGGKKDGEDTGADPAKLKGALDKERELRKAAERKVRELSKGEQQQKTDSDRLKELEAEVAESRLEKTVAKELDERFKDLDAEGFTFNIKDAKELVMLARPTADSADEVIDKVVEKLKQQKTAKPPATKQERTDRQKKGVEDAFDPAKFDAKSARPADWAKLHEANPAEYERQAEAYRKGHANDFQTSFLFPKAGPSGPARRGSNA